MTVPLTGLISFKNWKRFNQKKNEKDLIKGFFLPLLYFARNSFHTKK